MKIYGSVTELIGGTPLVEIKRYAEYSGVKARLLAKLEYFNPAGSVKDRVAKAMIEDAEKCGKLKAGATIIEPTSGNTGIGLAAVAAAKGYKVILTMPETMSIERRNLIKAYGAEIVLTPGEKGMKGAILKAEELHKKIPDSVIAGQFVNPSNPQAHKDTTAREIWQDTDGAVDGGNVVFPDAPESGRRHGGGPDGEIRLRPDPDPLGEGQKGPFQRRGRGG